MNDNMNYVTSRKVPLLHCLLLYVTSDPQVLLRAICHTSTTWQCVTEIDAFFESRLIM